MQGLRPFPSTSKQQSAIRLVVQAIEVRLVANYGKRNDRERKNISTRFQMSAKRLVAICQCDVRVHAPVHDVSDECNNQSNHGPAEEKIQNENRTCIALRVPDDCRQKVSRQAK